MRTTRIADKSSAVGLAQRLSTTITEDMLNASVAVRDDHRADPDASLFLAYLEFANFLPNHARNRSAITSILLDRPATSCRSHEFGIFVRPYNEELSF